MFDWVKENSTAFVVAIIFHLIFFGALFFNWQFDKPEKIVLQQGDIIQVTSVDANSYEAEIKKIEDQKQAKKRKARALEEKKKKKKQEQARRKKQQKQKAAELKRRKAAEAKKKKAAKKKAAEVKRKKAEAKRKEEKKEAEQEKLRLKEQKKRQAAEQKRKAEADRKRQTEIKRQQAQEKADWERRSKGIINKHAALIQNKIRANWRRPQGDYFDFQCRVDISLSPNGDVLSVKIVESSGNIPFDRSCETAVRKSSPLPVPSERALSKEFERMRIKLTPR